MKISCHSLWFIILVALLLGLIVGTGATRIFDNRHAPTADTAYVSTTIHDTAWIEKPVPIGNSKLKDSLRMLIAMNDTYARIIDSLTDIMPQTDTVITVSVPIEQKEYGDSTYHAWISGYEPKLDSIAVYNKTIVDEHTVVVHEYQPAKHWSLGIQAGIGIGVTDNKMTATPYIGLGLTYKLFEF